MGEKQREEEVEEIVQISGWLNDSSIQHNRLNMRTMFWKER